MVAVSEQVMPIGRFAALSNLTPKALRIYEREGLLTPVRVDSHNGYRWYGTEQLEPARLIGLLRGLQMPLDDIRRLLAVDRPVLSRELAEWWRHRDRQHRSRRALVGHIQSIINDEESPMYDVKTRHIPAHRVMSIQRRVFQPQLEEFILDTLATFTEHLDGAQPTGEFTVIYHGRVEADLDGPVEAIMGCPDSVQPSDAVGIRTEPAHDVAYTRLTKGQFEFPEILGAYDAVASSPEVQQRGMSPLGCREIYLGGWAELADDDVAGDIAFPLA